MNLRDPERCPDPTCYGHSRITKSRKVERRGYRYRYHVCQRCGKGWPSYDYVVPPSAIDPADVDPKYLDPESH